MEEDERIPILVWSCARPLSASGKGKGGETVRNVQAWFTTPDLSLKLQEQPVRGSGKEETDLTGETAVRIEVREEERYQTMDGFGASFTDASAYLIQGVLDEAGRAAVMRRLFDREAGIGMSFLRQPMGACDFNHEIYSYCDLPPGEKDPDLKRFSVAHDEPYILPLLKEALRIRPDLRVMASPWSPPGWMKTSGSMIGGTLLPEYYGVYAEYFVRFIHAYIEAGIPVYAVTPQNEPGYEPEQYPGMRMTPEEQITFIKVLGPALRKNGLDTLILCYDHNWDVPEYAERVLGDPEAALYTAGTAWHCYGGRHEAMSRVAERFPDKGVWFTEASGGEWIPPMRDAFLDQMKHVIRCCRNGSKTIVWWNVALDERNGPTVLRKSTCRGLLRITQETGEVEYNLDYYTMGHISRFVLPGAVRIGSDTLEDRVESAAFRNPDGSGVLILSNRTPDPVGVQVQAGNGSVRLTLPGEGAATLRWEE